MQILEKTVMQIVIDDGDEVLEALEWQGGKVKVGETWCWLTFSLC